MLQRKYLFIPSNFGNLTRPTVRSPLSWQKIPIKRSAASSAVTLPGSIMTKHTLQGQHPHHQLSNTYHQII